jgi:lysyl-tRNA synthetase class II
MGHLIAKGLPTSTTYCVLEKEGEKTAAKIDQTKATVGYAERISKKNMSSKVAFVELEEPREANQLQGLQRRVGDKLEDERPGLAL